MKEFSAPMTARPDRRPSRAWEWPRRNASAITALAAVAGAVLPAVERLLLR